MGTNFYLHFHRSDIECNIEGIHIGKNSAGWVFHFEAQSRPLIRDVKAMKALTKLGFIYDEYGKEYTYNDFWQLVEDTKEPYFGRDPYVLNDPENPEPAWFKRWEDEGFCFSEGEFS